MKQITSTNSGVLPDMYPDIIDIHAYLAYAFALFMQFWRMFILQRHQDAVILIDKILTYNPENNQGTRWLLGTELLRCWQA